MSYYDWVKMFEILKTSPMDDSIIKKLEDKNLDGNDYVLEKLINHVINTINTRLNNRYFLWVDRILSSNIDIDTLSLDLINLKKEKKFVIKIVSLPIFIGELSDAFKNVINERFEDIYNIIRKNIEYIDKDGSYIDTFNKIMLTSMED